MRSLWVWLVVGWMLGAGAAGAAETALDRARAAREAGDHAAAMPLLETAHVEFAATHGPDDPRTLDLLYDLADSVAESGQLERARGLYEDLITRRRARLGERHLDTLLAEHDLAYNFGSQGQHAEAARRHEKVLAVRMEVFGENHEHTQQSLNSVAQAWYYLGRLPQALEMFERTLRYRLATFGPQTPQTLVVQANRAALLRSLGRWREAAEVFRELVRSYEVVAGGRHHDRPAALNNLGALQRELGDLSDSLATMEQALALQVQLSGEKHPFVLEAMNNLATVYRDLGRHEESLVLFDRAIALAIELVGERHPTTLVQMNNRATTLAALGRHEEQLALSQRALELRRATQGERHPASLESMQTVADALGALGRQPEQLALSESLVALRMEVQGPRHGETLVAIGRHADLLREAGRAEEAVAQQAHALPPLRETLGDAHPSVLRAVEGLSRSLVAAGRWQQAAALAPSYVDGAEKQRAQPGLAISHRQSLFQKYARSYRFFGRVQLHTGRRAEALRLVELGKARTLLEGLAMRHAGRFGALPVEERRALEDQQREVAALEQLLAGASDAEARRELEVRRNQRARACEALQARLKTTYPKFAQLSDVRIVAARDVAARLGRDRVALNYLVDGDQLAALIVSPGGRLDAVDLGRLPQLEALVELLRQSLAWSGGLSDVLGARGQRIWQARDGSLVLQPASLPAPEDARALTQVAELTALLSARLLAPLERWLKPYRRWLIAPDGALAQLPFEVLPWGRGAHPAAAKAELQYTPSLSAFVLAHDLARQYEGLAGRRDLFVMADARYEGADGQASAWRNLPGTAAEARAVAALFPGPADLHLGDDATEARLQSLQLRGELATYRHLLFGTHGVVSPEQPALSAIVLGQQALAPGTDGQVTAAEWPGYDLRSDLVVLSGCDTGVGRVVTGEGVMGLPFALFVAGNVNTILTLWPVEDAASARFVAALFGRIAKGQRPGPALTATKREFIAHRRYAAPRFWAAFVLVGPH